MTPERWREVGELFARALAEPAASRAAWLAAAPADDEVRREVVELLAAHESAGAFLERPADAGPADAVPANLRPGAMLGAYRLVREIGRGGMGVVFEAEDTRLHRRVALKAVSVDGGDAEEQRLRREARAAAALAHPNIATVYALEELDGRAYLASEYLEGETLRQVLQRGPVPRDEALAIAQALARGLEAAHRRGIVHRDLKPENVLRLPDGQVKILDFGLAQLGHEARHLASGTHLTLRGLVAGTPGYMAPEQLLGAPVDARADQYALGVVLAEMVTGANPVAGTTLASTIARVLAADGVAAAAPTLPADIAAVVQRSTRQRPEDRYAETGDLAAAIAACRGGHHAGLRPPAPPVATSPAPAQPAVTGEGPRPPLWWWRFHQAAAAAINWGMVVPAWLVHRDVPRGLLWFLGCLAATIVAANVRLHLRFSAAVLPDELPSQRARTRGWVAVADWALILLWAYAGVALLETRGEWAAVFFAFAIGAAVAVALIEPATTRAAFSARGAGPR